MELGGPTEMFLAWFKDSKKSGSTLISKIYFPSKIVQVRVNGGNNLELYKVVIIFCLFICPIITHIALGRFAYDFEWGPW